MGWQDYYKRQNAVQEQQAQQQQTSALSNEQTVANETGVSKADFEHGWEDMYALDDKNVPRKSEMLSHSAYPKDVLEYCGDSGGMSSMIIFSHDLGVRKGYVYVPEKIANAVAQTIPNIILDVTDNDENAWMSALFKEQTGIELGGGRWVNYDCGHVGETYDEKSIRRYFPEDADVIIAQNQFRNIGYGAVYRSLTCCQDVNRTIVDHALNLWGASVNIEQQNGRTNQRNSNSYER